MKPQLLKLQTILASSKGYLLLAALSCIPTLYLLIHFFSQLSSYEQIQEEIGRIYKKSLYLKATHQKDSTFLNDLKNPDHFYIDKHLETLCFLEPEIKKNEALLLENPGDDSLKKRLYFLKEGPNKLLFSEIHTRQQGIFSEVEEKQQHPVEMDEEDLKKTLSLIEGVTIWPYGPKEKRPQLLIKDFELSKKETTSQEFVYTINMHLIKRESS